ncbi:MAG: T9SS type A sorting domain-containing protein [Bacteroidota bacterium]
MYRIRLLAAAVLLFTTVPAWAQAVYRVETVAANAGINDALALGPDGALYGSDFGNFTGQPGSIIRRVDLTDGTVTVYAQELNYPNGITFGPDGTLYVSAYLGRGVFTVPPGGSEFPRRLVNAGTTVSGALFDQATGTLYVTSYDSQWIRKIEPGVTTTLEPVVEGFAAGLNGPAGLALDDQGRLHVANFNDGRVHRVNDDGTTALVADVPGGIGFLAYGGGTFFASGLNNHRVYAITPAGEVTIIAGSGQQGSRDGVGSNATFDQPNGIVATASGDTLYVSDGETKSIRRLIREEGTGTNVEDTPVRTGQLHAPFPNPAQQSTTVRFELAEAGPASVLIYDLLGREVEHLSTGTLAAGTHTLDLATADWVPGSYLVRLETAGYAETTPLIVVR